MEDTIKVKVNENGKWMEYSLSFEEFAYISPILERCNNKKECTFDPNDPSTLTEIMQSIFMPLQNKHKGVIYNLQEKPHDMTKEEVMEIFERKGILYIESDNTHTQAIDLL